VLTILRKEINAFFSSLIGYMVIGVFLVTTGLFIWIFPNFNVLDAGYATLDGFFEFAPLIFLFLVPALTMRSLAEERHTGTIEILATKPLSDIQIILGKYFASLFLFVMALVPTLVYVYTISKLASPKGDIDTGAIIGSYIGLILIGSAFSAIGVFASSITSNQIVAFVVGVFLCFFAFFAFDFLSNLAQFAGNLDYYVKSLGLLSHYDSISRGVLDTRDLLYFITFDAVFIIGAKTAIDSRKW
jgi:ABC-2 type transport system permease protein